ncbi:malate/lactate/ureidoglycolate dehydrogenase [Azospirillum sp. RWY-5-1]|uniref:Malate/lactate/ureidoglycolate dehydrogenase n=1 Tax=Azospirillum oleiclasticum TaxID=2735135 RepID=A0ABX2TIX8_9PROT|nr:malate/lactate/ureidoglycolate dehydrogenase [Azospirillum oleiclasticum]NYZ17169.1 malate/lactate/ureidoglycolate dehydrogenase [Azospirillum oleiclasticum]NYZ23122.1 malate/lactate/ureidoglycolate dehydrogenase [Azospirillum oleiclasticum]
MPRLYAPDRLTATLDAILRASGSSPEEAATVARNLVEADAKGHASHGVCQIAVYMTSLERGHLTANRHARILRDDAPFLVVDGGFGYGQVIAKEATELAIERARRGGACILALRHAHHIGRVGAYGEQCVAAGLVTVWFVNVVSRPLAAPQGGARPRLGTNPICVAVPGTPGHPPMVLDFATSAIAANKCRVAASKGVEVADGLLIDPDGLPTRDPAVMFREPTGAILPFGGHKGYGLALACEILAGALVAGLPALPENLRPGRVVNNALAFVLDPARVAETGWEALADAALDYMEGTPPAPGTDRVRIPGDPEREHAARAARDGIALDPDTEAALHRYGTAFGLDVPGLLGVEGAA